MSDMSKLSTVVLEEEIKDLKTKKRRLVRDVDNIDTKLIGLKLELDFRREAERRSVDDLRGQDRLSLFDDED